MTEAIKELIVELEGIKEENELLKAQLRSMTSTLASDFIVLSEAPKVIKGIAIAEGTWNGDYYPAEALREIPNVGSIPVLVEHGDSEEFGTKAVGLVKEWEYIPLINAVAYQAEITDDRAWQLIKEGKLTGISLQSFVAKGNGGHRVLYMKPFEASLTSNPAVKYAYVAFSKMYLNEKGSIKSDIMTEVGKEEVKTEAVSATAPNATVEVKADTATAPTSAPKEYEMVQLEVKDNEVMVIDVMPEEEALKKKRPVAKVPAGTYYYYGSYGYPPYYYGYPYGYAYGYPSGYGYPTPKKRKLTDDYEDATAIFDAIKKLEDKLAAVENKISEMTASLTKAPEAPKAPEVAEAPKAPEAAKPDLGKLTPAELIVLEQRKKGL